MAGSIACGCRLDHLRLQAQAELRKALTAASRQAEGRGEAKGEMEAAAAMRVLHEREVGGMYTWYAVGSGQWAVAGGP